MVLERLRQFWPLFGLPVCQSSQRISTGTPSLSSMPLLPRSLLQERDIHQEREGERERGVEREGQKKGGRERGTEGEGEGVERKRENSREKYSETRRGDTGGEIESVRNREREREKRSTSSNTPSLSSANFEYQCNAAQRAELLRFFWSQIAGLWHRGGARFSKPGFALLGRSFGCSLSGCVLRPGVEFRCYGLQSRVWG